MSLSPLTLMHVPMFGKEKTPFAEEAELPHFNDKIGIFYQDKWHAGWVRGYDEDDTCRICLDTGNAPERQYIHVHLKNGNWCMIEQYTSANDCA